MTDQNGTKFNLHALVKSTLDTSDEADPGVLADQVAASIPSKALRGALRLTLRAYVREAFRAERNQISGSSQKMSETQSKSAAAGRSWKVGAIRNDWSARLNDRLHVGGKEWKTLGACTYDDLIAVADERQIQAERNAAWSVEYRRMADAIATAGVATFGEVPAAMQADLLGDVA